MLIFDRSYAQDTIVAIFNMNASHKDGYDIAHHIIEIPISVAYKCDKKKIMILGGHNAMPEDKWVKLKDYQEVQGRYEKEYKVDERGDTLVRKLWHYESSYSATSISIWDDKKQKWKLSTPPKDPNKSSLFFALLRFREKHLCMSFVIFV